MNSNLLNDWSLEWSCTVANNAMNRERKAIGINSYTNEIKLNVIEFIISREHEKNIYWTDLCCGRGKALIQVSDYFKNSMLYDNLFLNGIDLVDFFDDYNNSNNLSLLQLNLNRWQPRYKSDLITVVHGLHYIGDKIGMIIKSISSLKPDGLFVGNLDLDNIIIDNNKKGKLLILNFFKRNKINYSARNKIISSGYIENLQSDFIYLGADDKAGPNYTGQNAVNSFYKLGN